ncbi:Protein-glutamine gamma-glutamyltransferase [Caloramator mitchellensis]|uniref:Protein-glutamine gamma-glutamyltransferase n=1 Tax=Caloramator mitchellensis TaxID=908809 RepID=A0A0R3JWS9_CALMK|nr:transglutaminase domain-containing protein [Caloramator mitchellensis]KRQ88009.1 Protein-glutamine gamma-glutamyltransferase [Caloramator mitchellensis]
MSKLNMDYFILFTILTSIIYSIFIKIGYISIGLSSNLAFNCFVFVGINIFLYLLFKYKYLLFLAIIFLLTYVKLNFQMIMHYLKNILPFYQSILENQGVISNYFDLYIKFFYITVIFLSIVVFYLTFIKKRTVYLLILGLGLFSFYDFFGIDTFRYYNIFLILWFYLFWMSRNINVEKNKIHDRNYLFKLISLFTIFIFITNFAIKILPVEKEGKGYKLIEIANEMGEKINPKEQVTVVFGLKSTGFQPDSNKLGGPIKLNHNKAITVYPNNYSGELYLRGVIKDYYDGQKWKKSSNNFITGSKTNYNREGLRKFEIQITPTNLVTYTAFNVLFPESIRNTWNNFLIDADYLETKHPHPANRNDKYYVDFASYDYSIYTDYIQNKKWPTFKYSQDRYYFDYLRVPDIVSNKVYELTMSVIKDSRNDLEAAKRIQDYLRENYSYDLKPSIPPDNVDFVEHFLFEEKRGYCVYFASAMAIMLRTAGIPSRYVEGFAINATPFKEIDVLNSDAHAWVEAYINGLGFVTFDPTPGHYTTIDYAFDVLKNQTEIQEKDNQTEKLKENRVVEDNEAISQSKKVKNFYFELFVAFILVILMLIIIIFKRNKISTSYFVSKIKFTSFALGVNYEGLTLEELLLNIGQKLNIDMSIILEILNRNLYDDYDLTLEDKELLKNKFTDLEKELIKYLGIGKFIINKMNYGRFLIINKIYRFLKVKKCKY